MKMNAEIAAVECALSRFNWQPTDHHHRNVVAAVMAFDVESHCDDVREELRIYTVNAEFFSYDREVWLEAMNVYCGQMDVDQKREDFLRDVKTRLDRRFRQYIEKGEWWHGMATPDFNPTPELF